MVSYILAAITAILVLVADQFSKVFVSNNFEMAKSYEFLPGIIDITYIHNDGAAWGMLGGYTWLLLSITIVVMLACIALLLKWGLRDKITFWSAMLILSGGVGNMIDRIAYGYVIDMIDFCLFDFWKWIFNVADAFVCVGAGVVVLALILDLIKESKEKKQKNENKQ